MNVMQALDYAFSQCPKLKEAHAEFMATAEKDARVLAMQFDRKKAAFVTAKATNHKSGALDMNMLAQYKTADDLFARTKMNPKGKNHSFYVLLDWSGSMSGLAIESLRQAFIQALFLRRQKIDHKIMLFLSHGGYYHGQKDLVPNGTGPVGTVYDHHTELVVFFDSSMSKAVFESATKAMFMIGLNCGSRGTKLQQEGLEEYSRVFPRYGYGNAGQQNRVAADVIGKFIEKHGMGSTPLNISMLEIYNMMKREHVAKPDVSQNLVVITDGESGGLVMKGNAEDHAWNRENMLTAKGTYFTQVDGKTHNIPAVVLSDVERNRLSDSTAETYGVFSLFDWKVNRTMIFLTESRGLTSDVNRLVGYYDEKDAEFQQVAALCREGGKGRIMNISNVYGCVDDMFIVGIKRRRGDGFDVLDDEDDEKLMGRDGEIDIKKFAKAAAKQALANPLEHLAFVIGEAVAKNYTLNKNVHSAKSDVRVARMVWKERK